MPYGVDGTFFCSHRGERNEKTAVWNKKLQRFSNLTQSKKSANELMGRFGRSAFPRWKERTGYSMKSAAFPVLNRIAFMPPYDAAACGAVSKEKYTEMGYAVESGPQNYRLASILIIDSLERFHCQCPSREFIICVVYTIAKGIPVTTTACCNAAGGRVRQLPRSNIVEHVPANKRRVEFTFQDEFIHTYGDVVDAVRACSKDEASMWKVVDKRKVTKRCKAKCSDPAPRGPGFKVVVPACGGTRGCLHCEVGTIGDLWTNLQQLRRVKNDSTAALLWRRDRVGM